jgi:hypothetical protein
MRIIAGTRQGPRTGACAAAAPGAGRIANPFFRNGKKGRKWKDFQNKFLAPQGRR